MRPPNAHQEVPGQSLLAPLRVVFSLQRKAIYLGAGPSLTRIISAGRSHFWNAA